MGKIAQFAAALRDDTSGIILPYVTIMLGVIVGVSVLALDGSRYMSLQTQLQQGADAIALAAAAELNRKSDSVTRANAVINNFFTVNTNTQNKTWFGSGSSQFVEVSNVRYLSSLPASDATPIPDADVLCTWTGCTTAEAKDAIYVEVTVQPVSLSAILPASFFGGTNTMTIGAQAVAGFPSQAVCGIPPVFICNPYETAGMTDDEATQALQTALADPATTRKQLHLLNDGSTGPGHFGWLVPPDGNASASNLQDWISRTTPKTCFSSRSVDLDTGAKQAALDGFNVRFDIGADASHAADTNVRKGYVAPSSGRNAGSWCSAGPPGSSGQLPGTPCTFSTTGVSCPNAARALALPQDSCFATGGSCVSSFSGNGQWDCATYWSFNHHTAAAPAVKADGSAGVCGAPAATTLSRFDVYTYEINQGLVGDWSRGTAGSGANNNNWSPAPPYTNSTGEIGTALCTGTANAVQGRRVTYTAVINCLANSASITGGQTADDIPVAGYAKFFMTEPVLTTGAASNRQLIGEMTGLVGKLDKVRIIDQVQLYR